MYLYQAENVVSGNRYYGITNNYKRRLWSHKTAAKRGDKSKFYDAMRSYGIESFNWSVLEEGDAEYIMQREIELIANDPNCYNLHPGGGQGFSMLTKSDAEVEEWRQKLRDARVGRKPALGMHHTDETKKLCGEYGKARWDKYGRYPLEVLDYGFAEANRKFGISKTHYYRMRRQVSDLT